MRTRKQTRGIAGVDGQTDDDVNCVELAPMAKEGFVWRRFTGDGGFTERALFDLELGGAIGRGPVSIVRRSCTAQTSRVSGNDCAARKYNDFEKPSVFGRTAAIMTTRCADGDLIGPVTCTSTSCVGGDGVLQIDKSLRRITDLRIRHIYGIGVQSYGNGGGAMEKAAKSIFLERHDLDARVNSRILRRDTWQED